MSTKKQKNARSGQNANLAQGASETKDAQPVETSAQNAPVATPRGKRAKGEATLSDVCDGYLDSLEKADKSEGTIFSYRMDLKAALDHFGEDSPASTLSPTKVANFYASDGVTKKRNGRKRSEITIAKTRRVFRLALVWAAERGMIEKAPIPADEMEHARGAGKVETKDTSKAASAKKATRKVTKAIEAPAAEPTPAPAAATPTE